VRYASVFTLMKDNRKTSETLSESVVVSLEGNVNVFSPVCFLKIRIVEDVATGAVDVCLVRTLVDSPNR